MSLQEHPIEISTKEERKIKNFQKYEGIVNIEKVEMEWLATHYEERFPNPENRYKKVRIKNFQWKAEKRLMTIDVFLPRWYKPTQKKELPLLILNDGQDLEAIELATTLQHLELEGTMHPLIVMGIHTTRDRKQIYGVAHEPDYAQRGSLAGAYSKFIIEEVLPWAYANFKIIRHPEALGIGGFSLGALSAFDIAWSYPNVFRRVAALSASFWWRSKAYDKGYTDLDRIMLAKIKGTDAIQLEQKFWFQCGTLDEASDRDKDGLIDSIGDTLDTINLLQNKGFANAQLPYYEIINGTHNQACWRLAMPAALQFLFA